MTPSPNVAGDAADERDPALVLAPRELEGAQRAVVEMFLDLPAIADGEGDAVPPLGARHVDQRTHVVLGAATVVMQDVQDARPAVGARSCASAASRSGRSGSRAT